MRIQPLYGRASRLLAPRTAGPSSDRQRDHGDGEHDAGGQSTREGVRENRTVYATGSFMRCCSTSGTSLIEDEVEASAGACGSSYWTLQGRQGIWHPLSPISLTSGR